MRAGVLHATGDLRIEELPRPVPTDGEVLVRVRFNGLCGTDATEYGRAQKMVPLARPHPASGHVGPTVLGHEWVGEVVAAGRGAEGLVGQRVVCGAGVSCGSCRWCREGRTNLCADYYTIGLSTHGGLAEFVTAPAATCLPVPEGCGDEDAALAQPLAVALHAVRRAEVRDGATVALFGAGAIASFIAVALRGRDVRTVAFDIDEDNLARVRRLGVEETFLVDRDVTADELRALLPAGADRSFEVTGAPGALGRAAALAARGGTVMLVGLSTVAQELVTTPLVLEEIDLRTTVAHVCDEDLPAALELLSSTPLAAELVDRTIPLESTVSAGLQPLLDGTAKGKILVEMTHD